MENVEYPDAKQSTVVRLDTTRGTNSSGFGELVKCLLQKLDVRFVK